MNNLPDWFNAVLDNRQNISVKQYDQLTASLYRYPYFQLLIVKKLAFIKRELPDQYDKLLKRYALALTHKGKLFESNGEQSKDLLAVSVCNGDKFIASDSDKFLELPSHSDTDSILTEEDTLSTEINHNEPTSEEDALGIDQLIEKLAKINPQAQVQTQAFNPLEQLLTDSPYILEELEEETVDSGWQTEIIDRFINEQPRIIPRLEELPQVDLSNITEEKADDELFSETLARIYVKQELYDKAIATYIKLSLKYPEKSVYFANRIENIKEKIKH